MRLLLLCIAAAVVCALFTSLIFFVLYPFFFEHHKRKTVEAFKKRMDKFRGMIEVPEGIRKLVFIGSTQYELKMEERAEVYRDLGCFVYLPAFDHDYDDPLTIWGTNRELIKAADEVHVFWDQRSTGTIFDIGMAFALEKPVVIEFLEGRTIAGTLAQYSGKEGWCERRLTSEAVAKDNGRPR